MNATASVKFRSISATDAAMLTDLMRRAFVQAFSHNTGAEDLKAYMDSHFTIRRQRSELSDPKTVNVLVTVDGHPAGYAQMDAHPPPDFVEVRRPVQLRRFYLLKSHWGAHIADELMQVCLERLAGLGYDGVWLSCWDQNARALAFYRRWGFRSCGTAPFIVGNDRQTDFILVRWIGPDATDGGPELTKAAGEYGNEGQP